MKSKIKISEIFYSLQGEGRYQGVPSIFLRTFGCNFTCDGFGMAKGERSNERNLIAMRIDEFKEYKNLPLANTGCDSYASWDPKFKDFSKTLTIEEIVKTIIDLLPHKEWRREHLVITGGEPLLGWQRIYPELLRHINMQRLRELTFETNGTQHLHNEFMDYLILWSNSKDRMRRNAVTFSVSPKLSISGHTFEEAILPDVVCHYEHIGYTYLKFVVSTEDDVKEALEATNVYRTHGFKGPVYLMPLGGVETLYNLNKLQVAELALKHGLRYSDRLHIPLWKNAWGT